MIVIDTNVVSELWKAEPDRNVMTWIDAQMIESCICPQLRWPNCVSAWRPCQQASDARST
ncbi:hypothetical protein QO004_004189 [Rhizobium mesoamericanum]|nr:hypothetical protein [Rhizobium mesoamericanum]